MVEARADASWPQVAVPDGVQTFSIASDMSFNAWPMRLSGFVSAMRPEDVAEKFRLSMGKPLIENRIANTLVLGQGKGNFYLTVQIESAAHDAGSRGVIAVSDMRTAIENRASAQESNQRLLQKLPPGTELVSQMTSRDGKRYSRHIVFQNRQPASTNSDYLKTLLADEGLSLERSMKPDESMTPGISSRIAEGQLMFFSGANKEAFASIMRDPEGHVVTVLNIVSEMEHFK